MKIIKNIFLTIAFIIIFNISAFGESGFEFSGNFQLGMSVGIPTKSLKDIGFKSDIGLDFGCGFQFGYMFQIKNNFGISALVELGYNVGSYSIKGKLNINELISEELSKLGFGNININELGILNNVSASFINYFYSIQVGLFPKFNIGNFSIGIGGGIKIPIMGWQTLEMLGIEEDTGLLYRPEISDLISPAILGYVKTSFDYSFYIFDKTFINVGLYLGFDIMKNKSYEWQKGEYGSTFNVGVIFGIKYGASVN